MPAGRPPYVGLTPGTTAWMDCWKSCPTLQQSMISYAKLHKSGILLVEDIEGGFRVRNSALKSIANCNCQAHLRYILELVPLSGRFAMEVGTAIHEAIADMFRGVSYAGCKETFTRCYPQGKAPEERLSFDNVDIIFSHWLKSNPVENFPFSVSSDYVELWVEQILDEEKKLILTAQVDLIGRDQRTGALYIIDHKTTGKISEWWLKQWRLASGLTGYYWIAQKLFPGQMIAGCAINAIELPKLPQAGKKCKRHNVDYAECRKFHPAHQQLVVQRNPWTVEEWKRSAIWLASRLKDLHDNYNDVLAIPYIRQQGMFGGGCVFCDYAEFCLAGRPLEWIGTNLVSVEGMKEVE